MKRLHVIGYAVLVVLLLVTFTVYSRHQTQLELENLTLRYRLNWIADSAQRLAKGEGGLAIYSMKDTDGLLSCFAHRGDVDNVSLEMTDIGPVGISSIASMPNVKLISFSGDFGVNDQTVMLLAKCSQLKTLELTSTKVTDAGITTLGTQLPNCKIERG